MEKQESEESDGVGFYPQAWEKKPIRPFDEGLTLRGFLASLELLLREDEQYRLDCLLQAHERHGFVLREPWSHVEPRNAVTASKPKAMERRFYAAIDVAMERGRLALAKQLQMSLRDAYGCSHPTARDAAALIGTLPGIRPYRGGYILDFTHRGYEPRNEVDAAWDRVWRQYLLTYHKA